MNQLPSLHELSSEQKDALIMLLWEENQTLKEQIKILKQENADLKAQIVDLKAQVADLKAQVADLTQKLNSNSQNSHKPPSSDGFKRTKIQREKSTKKNGGQIGHQGQTLRACDHSDFIIEHEIDRCSCCGTNIKNTHHVGYKTAQVFEIPQLEIEVTEHRIFEKICPCCGSICSANLPNGITFGMQYGARLKSFLIYLHHYHYVASERITEFFRDIFGHHLSEGMVFKAEEEAFSSLDHFEKELKELLKGQAILHADETSLRVEGKNQWLHVLSTKELTHYFVHKKRGKKATDECQILPHFDGILISDHWKAYFQYECSHALCNAHHLRELKAVFEGTGHEWANQMSALLKEIKRAKEENNLQPSILSSFETRYDEIIKLGYAQAEQVHQRGPPSGKSHPKEICLLDRLKKRKSQVLMFMYKQDVPFDNNQAERDIRMMKVKMKVSGCFRQKIGAQIFCRIRGYISTMKKKGISILHALIQAINDQAISCLAY